MRKAFGALAVVLAGAAVVLIGGQDVNARRHGDGNPHLSDHSKGDTIWVVNRDLDTLTVFDADTGAIRVGPVFAGPSPHDIVVSRRAGKVYVTNDPGNEITVFSAKTVQSLGAIPIGVNTSPHHAKVSADGRTVYVGLNAINRTATIDTDTDTVLREYTTSANPTARAHAPRPSLSGRLIFVPHEMNGSVPGNEVSAIDAESGDIVMSVNAGVSPSEVLPARGRRLYVTVRGEGKVKVIDLKTHAIVDEVEVGAQPESLMLTKDQRTLVVTLRGTPAQIAFVNTDDMSLIGTVPLTDDGAGTFGDLAVMSPDRRFVYATFDRQAAGTGGVSVVDVRKMKRVATWDYPSTGRPHGIAYSTTRLRLP
jgi:YVTN family beta-propeller protein